MMYSSDTDNSNSIRQAFFNAAIQLTIPTVTSTVSVANETRANSITEKLHSPTSSQSLTDSKRNSSSSNRLSRQSVLIKPKVLRDVATQSSPVLAAKDQTHHRPNHLDLILDNNNNPTTISATSKEYLSVPQHYQHQTSPNTSPTRYGRSLKDTLLGIWQGLNSDELRSAASSPIDPKCLDERIRKSSPSWKAFSKVVTTLLTFTRTKKEQYQWVQLVGHPGTFKEGFHDGYILKELCEPERRCCELLHQDVLKDFVPKYKGTVQGEEGKSYIEIQDLLASFHEPCIMDCKMGVRTYLEEDLNKSERDPEPRNDLYQKMIAIDPTAPTEEENEEKKILKPRYMIWRESLSSSQELGFRIEAIKKCRGLMSKEFQTMKERNDIRKQLMEFIAYSILRANQYLSRLNDLRSTCLHSDFFRTHELIGSSLLFVHDTTQASIWMIDFGKTRLLPSDICITHSKSWIRGTHEDGYLIGLDNLILLFQEIIDELKITEN